MQLTQKLLSYIHRVFDKRTTGFAALQITAPGTFVWTLADGILTLSATGIPNIGGAQFDGTYDFDGAISYNNTATGTSNASVTIDTSTYTIGSLVAYIETLPVFSVTRSDTLHSAISCSTLVDGTGGPDDPIYGTQSLLYSYLNAVGAELNTAKTQIPLAVLEIYLDQADDEWLDVFGSYFDIPRLVNEQDGQYRARMVFYCTQPKQNNVSISAALETLSGVTGVRIVDSSPAGAPQQSANIALSIAAGEGGRFPGAPRWWRIGAVTKTGQVYSYAQPTYDFTGDGIDLPALNNVFELGGAFSYPATSKGAPLYDGTREYDGSNYHGWVVRKYIDAMAQVLDPAYATALFWDVLGRFRAAGTHLRKASPVLPLAQEVVSTTSTASFTITDSSTDATTVVTLADNTYLPAS